MLRSFKIEDIRDIPNLRHGVLLAPYSTWKIGGPARYFWEPTRELLPDVVRFCKSNGIKVWYLGRGSNVLIDSKGLDGLVICTKRMLQSITLNDGMISAESGLPMPTLSKFAAKLGYGGYEYLIGIPGTVGAGIAINAGLSANGRKEIGDVLIDVELMDEQGNIFIETKEQLEFKYRGSNIPERRLFVVSARFKSTYISTKEEIKSKTAEHLAARRNKQPLSKATAGSTFKRPEGGMPAGWYIDKAGLKGFTIGDAMVSKKHANWIINLGNASSDDIIELLKYTQEIVFNKFNVTLIPEVEILNNYKKLI